MLMGVVRRAFEAHVKAHRAADAALGLVLHPLGPCEPVVAIIVRIDDGNAKLLGEADVLILAQFVFLKRMDVGVVEKKVKSMPDACMASITSPEHGAQQECSSALR